MLFRSPIKYEICRMSHAYQIHMKDAAYFLTMTAIEWIDILMRAEHKQIICDSLNFCVEHKGLEIYAYVIMSSHLHLIASAKNGNLSDVIRDFKKFTSAMLIKEIIEGKESRRDWMLEIINEGGKKQTKKSINQVWHIIIMQRKFIVLNSPCRKSSISITIPLKPD